MHTSYNDGRAIATTKTDPPLNNFQFNFANVSVECKTTRPSRTNANVILEQPYHCWITLQKYKSTKTLLKISFKYSMCNLLLLQVAYLFRRGRCLKGR
ncbi:hypothetical protein T4E_3851 [Trichinella pseudospiralis]|uniref:Uncharacterized protein n=1 Tax=Trichinella pseudospiralis TaxID=6337 RepID=A0A0V0Y9C3_TRIPS|nr:hypothetical protein T4E_3851 [Trichinella pseudospiralis]